jgi:hypothetical protein
MALLEGPPMIAEDLLEGIFVDPLLCGCHSAWLYHVLAPRSTRLSTLLRPSVPTVFPCSDGQKEGVLKRKFLYAQVTHYKIPRYIKFVEAFPMTVTGKIQKFVMRQQTMAELNLQEAKTA